jgi:hypothetical protein
MGIGNQPHHPIDPKSGHAAMASRLNWGNSLERVKEGLDDCALSEQELLNPRHDGFFIGLRIEVITCRPWLNKASKSFWEI